MIDRLTLAVLHIHCSCVFNWSYDHFFVHLSKQPLFQYSIIQYKSQSIVPTSNVVVMH